MRKVTINHRRPHSGGGRTNLTATLFGATVSELAARARARGYEVHERADGVSWRIRPGVCYNAFANVGPDWVALGSEQFLTFYRCMDVWQMREDARRAA